MATLIRSRSLVRSKKESGESSRERACERNADARTRGSAFVAPYSYELREIRIPQPTHSHPVRSSFRLPIRFRPVNGTSEASGVIRASERPVVGMLT